MARSKSSSQWMKEHVSDHYVGLAQKEGYRSRAVYKLIELDKKERLFKSGDQVIELGAAPGSWTQYAAEKIGINGRIIAIDLLPMDTFANVHFIQGDFSSDSIYESITTELGKNRADLVISDMAPNITGNGSIDQPKAMYLAELAFDLATEVLGAQGVFLSKVFQGEGFDAYVKTLRKTFKSVKICKPKASRPRSREVYVIARTVAQNPKL